MALESTPPTWDEAYRDFILHKKATRAQKTVRFYDVQLRQLIHWADSERIPFEKFGKRHLDQYLAHRLETVSRTTVRHDGVAAKAFYKWCAQNDLLLRSPLMDVQVRNAPTPSKYLPSEEEIKDLLQAVGEYWDPKKNPDVRFIPHARRFIHRERNYAILLLLLDTAARIGELVNLKVDDLNIKDRQIVIRESKGREPRTLPISPSFLEALESWTKIRRRMASNMKEGEDDGWLFLSEFGGRMDESRISKAFKAIVRWRKLPEEMTLHTLRHFALTQYAKHNLPFAQKIAGHKDPKTTMIYVHLSADYVREQHKEVDIIKGVLTGRRSAAKRKKVI